MKKILKVLLVVVLFAGKINAQGFASIKLDGETSIKNEACNLVVTPNPSPPYNPGNGCFEMIGGGEGTISGGTPPYTSPTAAVTISNDRFKVEARLIYPNDQPRNYSVVINDAAGCSVTSSVMVMPYHPRQSIDFIVFSPSKPTCAGANDGSISGGTSRPVNEVCFGTVNYSIEGVNGTVFPKLIKPINSTTTGLAAGTYQLSWLGCACLTNTFWQQTITLTNQSTTCPPMILTPSVISNAICTAANGSAKVVATGGTGVYTYAWSNGATTATATGLAAGTYTVSVTSGSDVKTSSVVVPQTPCPPLVLRTGVGVASFCTMNNGRVTTYASGGTGTYTYSWNTSPIQTTAIATNLAPGTYTVTVTSGSNTQTATVTIAHNNPTLNISLVIIPNTQLGISPKMDARLNGISLSTNSFSLVWNNGLTINPIPITQHQTPIPYTVIVTSQSGCKGTATMNY
jgi:hypothetical protein